MYKYRFGVGGLWDMGGYGLWVGGSMGGSMGGGGLWCLHIVCICAPKGGGHRRSHGWSHGLWGDTYPRPPYLLMTLTWAGGGEVIIFVSLCIVLYVCVEGVEVIKWFRKCWKDGERRNEAHRLQRSDTQYGIHPEAPTTASPPTHTLTARFKDPRQETG